MRKSAFVFLLVGFVIGYAIVFQWTKQRAPELVRATVRMPQDRASAPESVPPLDMARVRSLQEQVKQNPQDFAALVELGNIHFDQRNFSDAINWYSKALEVEPDNVSLRTDLGTAYFYSERIDEAIAEFNKSLALNPTHPQALFNMGVALLHGKNDAKGALEYWGKLVETNPNDPKIALVKEQIQALKEQDKDSAQRRR